MSDPKIKVPNVDNKIEEESNTTKQADPDAPIHFHAVEDKETDVCRTVLREEKADSRERGELDVESKFRNVITRVRQYIVLNVNDGKPSDKSQQSNPPQEQQPTREANSQPNAQEPNTTEGSQQQQTEPLQGPNQSQTQETIPIPVAVSSSQRPESQSPQQPESSPQNESPQANRPQGSDVPSSNTDTSSPRGPEVSRLLRLGSSPSSRNLPQGPQPVQVANQSQVQIPTQEPTVTQVSHPTQSVFPPEGPYPPQGPYTPNGPYPSRPPYTPQGPYPPQDPYPRPPQGPYPPNGPYPPQGPQPPQSPYPPDGPYPPHGPNPPDTPYPPDGRYPPQGTEPHRVSYAGQGPFQHQGSSQPRSSFRRPGLFPWQVAQRSHSQQESRSQGLTPSPKRRSLIPAQVERIRCIVITGALVDYEPENEDRNVFVKFVLGIVLMMLIVTIASLLIILSISTAKHFLVDIGIYLLFPLIFTLIGLYCYMSCSKKGRTYPCNLTCLAIAVSLQTTIAAIITVYFKTQIVMYSVITTAMVIFVCVILAHTKFDFTSGILYFVALGVSICVLCVILILSMSTYKLGMKPALAIILMLFTVMSVLSLIMDLQIILGGRTIQLRVTDYALAAFMLYTSIMDIFIKMVLLLGISN